MREEITLYATSKKIEERKIVNICTPLISPFCHLSPFLINETCIGKKGYNGDLGDTIIDKDEWTLTKALVRTTFAKQ